MTLKQELLKWDETLFRDLDVFDLSYVPDQLYCRDEQTEALAFSIKPGLRGYKILDTLCVGPPATGKTTSIRKIFESIRELSSSIIPIQINCKIDSTEYAIFTRIYSTLTKQQPPAGGTSIKFLLDLISAYVLEKKIQLLICLDDANYLVYQKTFVDALYPLVRIHETYPGVQLGLIVIFSDPNVDLEMSLDVRTRSSFHPQYIEYPPYTAEEMAKILDARVRAGLYPNVLSSEILDKIVEISMKFGDVRMGLDIIKRAVLIAEKDARKSVTIEDISQIVDSQMNLMLFEHLKVLSSDETQVLSKIVELSSEGEQKSTKDIEDALAPSGPKKSKLAEIFRSLENSGLLTLTYQNSGNGRRRLIQLSYLPQDYNRCFSALKPKTRK